MNYSYFQQKRLKRQNRIVNVQMIILAILFLISIGISIFRAPVVLKAYITPQAESRVQIDTREPENAPKAEILTIRQVVAERDREVTAYNVGDPSQTDDSPCIGASGVDICNLLDHGVCVYAANFVKMGTYLSIKGVDCQVLDRLNEKYPNRVDIAMPLSEKEAALNYGIKTENVRVLKN